MIKFVGKNGGILAVFALATTSLIAGTYWLTKDKIEEEKQKQLLATLNQLVPESTYTNILYSDCVLVNSDALLGSRPQKIFRAFNNDVPVAAIIETTATNGYSGDIDLVVAVTTDNTVLGARVVAHKETPGLGDKIDLRISDWILSFVNVQYKPEERSRWQVKKDGGQFDQFTGATITPRAVISAVANAAEYARLNHQRIYQTSADCFENTDMREKSI